METNVRHFEVPDKLTEVCRHSIPALRRAVLCRSIKSNCRRKYGSVSSVIGKMRSLDFVGAISVMVFVPGGTLKGIDL